MSAPKLREHATSIVLVLLAAGAAAYAFFDRDAVTVNEAKTREGRVFVVWRREELSRVSIARAGAGANVLLLEKTADDAGDPTWMMREPRAEVADSEAVDRLLGAFEFATPIRKVDADAGIGGFDAPKITGSITMGALTTKFTLGGEAPTPQGAAYLKIEGPTQSEIFVVPRDFVAALTEPASTYRKRAIVPYLSVELAKMTVTSGMNHFEITRVDDTSFKLSSGLRASRRELDRVWSALAELRAETFLADDEADRATASPVVTITMTPSDAAHAPGELKIGGACPGHDADVVVVRTKPTRLSACAPKGSLEGLTLGEADLVDRALFATHDDEVTELRVEAVPKGAVLDVARKDAGWTEREPKVSDLSKEEGDAASALASAITHAAGEKPTLGASPFTVASRVTLARAGTDASEIVEVSAPDASGDVLARRAFDGAVLHVPAAAARALFPRAVALRPRVLTTSPIAAKDVHALATDCDGVTQSLHLGPDGWRMEIPSGFTGDNAAVLDTIDAIVRAKPDAWIADADDGHFGFDHACTLTTDAVAIAFGKPADDSKSGVYARLANDPAVMVLPKSVRDLASTWLVDRHGFTLADLAQVKLTQSRPAARSVVVSSDSGADPDDLVFRTLASLRAERALHLGPARPEEGFGAPSLVVEAVTMQGKKRRFVLGAESVLGDEKVYFARVDDVPATFAIDQERVRPLFERLPR